MIKKVIQMCLLGASSMLFVSPGNADAVKTNNEQNYLNKDGSRISLKYSPNKRQVFVTWITGDKRKLLLKLKPAIESNINLFSATMVDIDNDGFGDIEVSGDCGNRVCEKTIYRFNSNQKSFMEFFKGAYSTVKLDGKFLITGGGSGCCSYEYKIYELKQKDYVANTNPDYIVSISNFGEGEQAKVECTFSDNNAKTIPPPKVSWETLCEIYGKNYKLVLP